MADDQEKIHEASDKKIEDTRKEGDVAKSAEINGFGVLMIGSLVILGSQAYISEHIKNIYFTFFQFNKIKEKKGFFEVENVVEFVNQGVMEMAYILIPFLSFVVVFAVISNISQFGFIMNPLKIDFGRMNPINGIKNVFGLKKIVDMLKMTMKFMIAIMLLFVVLFILKDSIIGMMRGGLENSVEGFILATVKILGLGLLIVGLFAIVDLVFIRMSYFKKLMMSTQEMRDEYKNMEGDPVIKQRIRELQRKMSQGTMLKEVPNANVVIVNPTHYAVAIGEDDDFQPRIVAKGVDGLALRIKAIATDNDIKIIENKALARALYSQTNVGQLISHEFYVAVKAILEEVEYQNYIKEGLSYGYSRQLLLENWSKFKEKIDETKKSNT